MAAAPTEESLHTPSHLCVQVLSSVTLALAQDSGWYTPYWAAAGFLRFGTQMHTDPLSFAGWWQRRRPRHSTHHLVCVQVLSSVTLALAQDSGWYTPYWAAAGFLRFGWHAGCPLLVRCCCN